MDESKTSTVTYGVESAIDTLYERPTERPSVRYVRALVHGGKGGRIEVRGSNEAAVRKVYSERVAMWKAGAWAGPQHNEIIEQGTDSDPTVLPQPGAGR